MKGLFLQEIKTLFKSPSALAIVLIPIVLMVGLGYLIPSSWIVPSAITIGIVGSVLLYFGGSLEEIKRTSFMKSISLTRLNKFTFLSTKILFSMIVSAFSVLWVLFFAWLFTEPIHFLADDFSHLLVPSPGINSIKDAILGLMPNAETPSQVMDIVSTMPFSINWSNINWFGMIYAGIVTIIVSISISFVFVAFSKSSLSFYLMSFGYLLAMILFGGVVMPSFLLGDNSWFKTIYYFIPNFYTNNIMSKTFGSGIGDTVNGLINTVEHLGDPNSNSVEIWEEILTAVFGNKDIIAGGMDKIASIQTPEMWLIFKQIHAAGVDFSGIPVLGHFLDVDWTKDSFEQLSIVDKTNFKVVYSLINGVVSNPNNVDGIQELLLNNVGKISNEINQYTPAIVQAVTPILEPLKGMFGTVELYNWFVPWAIVAVLLLISIKWFKWS